MKDICYNAVNFFQSPRGLNLHPDSQLPPGQLGYDFNTGKDSTTHSTQRRDQSCPGTWKKNHLCPEYNQRPVMRHDGEWYTTELEPGTKINEIKARPAMNGRPAETSKLRYSCEEFPAATWVEGGSGIGFVNPAFTRCAGFNCKPGAKSEQTCERPFETSQNAMYATCVLTFCVYRARPIAQDSSQSAPRHDQAEAARLESLPVVQME